VENWRAWEKEDEKKERGVVKGRGQVGCALGARAEQTAQVDDARKLEWPRARLCEEPYRPESSATTRRPKHPTSAGAAQWTARLALLSGRAPRADCMCTDSVISLTALRRVWNDSLASRNSHLVASQAPLFLGRFAS
jgi:hypothetical protein